MAFFSLLPQRHEVPVEWSDYFSPLGATGLTFGLYLLVLALNLAWDSLWDRIDPPRRGFIQPCKRGQSSIINIYKLEAIG